MRNMNLARFIILVSILGSIVLAWRAWTWQQELGELRDSLDHRAPTLVGEIQTLADRHSRLSRQLSKDGMAGQANPDSYVRRVASLKNVEIGLVDITPARPAEPQPGVVDKKYRIEPSDRKREYRRGRIANFLYKLEEQSRRVVVTDIELTNTQKGLKPHMIPNDTWSFQVEITSRERKDVDG